jgi:hypothetical protein
MLHMHFEVYRDANATSSVGRTANLKVGSAV